MFITFHKCWPKNLSFHFVLKQIKLTSNKLHSHPLYQIKLT